jgi:tRNA nucleotidyltransferase (CCA-adding enzyme)
MIDECLRVGHWEHFEHRADIGLRATADDRAELFELIARAMTAAITDPDGVAPSHEVAIDCEAPNDEVLLVDWLNALIYEMATRRMLFGAFDVTLEHSNDRCRLHGVARGEPVDRDRHRPVVEVKGATYTALAVQELDDGGWQAQCVVDV